jgi:hypothetical protein
MLEFQELVLELGECGSHILGRVWIGIDRGRCLAGRRRRLSWMAEGRLGVTGEWVGHG